MTTPREGDTRERIMSAALDLFAESGYEKTSLREIAEQLDITKAAVYYHFKTKDDILNGIIDSLIARVDAIIAWGHDQPAGAATRSELLRRYTAQIRDGGKLMRFFQENQASLRHLEPGKRFRDRVQVLHTLLVGDEPDLAQRVRVLASIMIMHAGWMFREEHADSDDQMADAILTVAEELVNDPR